MFGDVLWPTCTNLGSSWGPPPKKKRFSPTSNWRYSRALRHLHLLMAVGIFGATGTAQLSGFVEGQVGRLGLVQGVGVVVWLENWMIWIKKYQTIWFFECGCFWYASQIYGEVTKEIMIQYFIDFYSTTRLRCAHIHEHPTYQPRIPGISCRIAMHTLHQSGALEIQQAKKKLLWWHKQTGRALPCLKRTKRVEKLDYAQHVPHLSILFEDDSYHRCVARTRQFGCSKPVQIGKPLSL